MSPASKTAESGAGTQAAAAAQSIADNPIATEKRRTEEP
jgi:hypothetical protein